MADKPILVKVTFSYTPVNNDEVCIFLKSQKIEIFDIDINNVYFFKQLRLEQGEILTVTRKEDGGWWEGTLSNGSFFLN